MTFRTPENSTPPGNIAGVLLVCYVSKCVHLDIMNYYYTAAVLICVVNITIFTVGKADIHQAASAEWVRASVYINRKIMQINFWRLIQLRTGLGRLLPDDLGGLILGSR